jgi:hypothetical protein
MESRQDSFISQTNLVHQVFAVVILANMTNHAKDVKAFVAKFAAGCIHIVLLSATDNHLCTIMPQTTSNLITNPEGNCLLIG